MLAIQHPLKDLYPTSLPTHQAFTVEESIRYEDIMSLVAKHLSDKDLVCFSAVDLAMRQMGLQERCIKAEKTFKSELQEFIELAVPDTSACIPGTNLIDFYRNFLIILKSHIEVGNSAEERDAFRQKHQERLINFVAQDSLTLSQKLEAAIWEKTLSFNRIQEDCESVKYSIIFEAVNTTINKEPNPLALRGLAVSAATKSHNSI